MTIGARAERPPRHVLQIVLAVVLALGCMGGAAVLGLHLAMGAGALGRAALQELTPPPVPVLLAQLTAPARALPAAAQLSAWAQELDSARGLREHKRKALARDSDDVERRRIAQDFTLRNRSGLSLDPANRCYPGKAPWHARIFSPTWETKVAACDLWNRGAQQIAALEAQVTTTRSEVAALDLAIAEIKGALANARAREVRQAEVEAQLTRIAEAANARIDQLNTAAVDAYARAWTRLRAAPLASLEALAASPVTHALISASHVWLIVYLMLLALHFATRVFRFTGLLAGQTLAPGACPLAAPAGAPTIATAPNHAEVTVAPGEAFHVAFRFLRTRAFRVRAVPPRPLGSPLARLLHGVYWLASVEGGKAGEALDLVGPRVTGTFAAITLGAGETCCVNPRSLVGFGGHRLELHTLLGRVLSPACWLLGQPLPVVFRGPGTVLVYGTNPRWEAPGPAGRHAYFPKQLLAFDAAAPFTSLALEPRSRVTEVFNVFSRQARVLFPAGAAVLVEGENPAHGGSLRLVVHVLLHLASLLLLFALMR